MLRSAQAFGFYHRGFHLRRADHGHVNALACQFNAQDLGQTHHAVFGRAIGRISIAAHQPRHGCHKHKLASTGQVRHGCGSHITRTDQIDVDDPLIFLIADRHKFRCNTDTRTMNHPVRCLPCRRLIKCRAHRAGITHIHGVGPRSILSSQPGQLRHGLPGWLNIKQGDGIAAAHVLTCQLQADATGTAGNVDLLSGGLNGGYLTHATSPASLLLRRAYRH